MGVVGRGQRLPPTARKREAKKGGIKKRKREGVRRKETMRGRGKEKENGAKGGGGRSRQRLGGAGVRGGAEGSNTRKRQVFQKQMR